ncbi:MAG: endolytic transglycosylase MltG [Chloroflexi bacterium]|nr:endolytic transglycosylase MltG [Chloroflexota bacterium]
MCRERRCWWKNWPLIAGVFLNRLAQGMSLSADPTVQYAAGYDAATDSWWKVPLYVSDLEFDSPYNTYLYPGLPPGPIAAPSLSALQAVANPAVTDFLFFVADCLSDVVGDHSFSVTFDEHLLKAQRCR